MATNLIKLLEKDHEEVRSILEEMQETGNRAGRKRETLYEKLALELTMHMRAEERTLYMALGEDKKDRPQVLEAMEEHHVAERVLSELKRLGTDDERWLPKVKVLKEIIEHHLEEEEGEIFKTAKSKLDAGTMQSLEKSFVEEKEKVRRRIA